MGAQSNAPVIIKRKKVVAAGGHHGGAWKVAYADFVTAMMAFFLLMWLLNATTEKQRKGLADYFSPTVPMARVSGGGDGAFGGNSVFSEESMSNDGAGATNLRPTEADKASGESTGESDQSMKKVEEALFGTSGESLVSENAKKHILTRVTDEGLIVEIFDIEGDPLFYENTAEPTPLLQEITAMLSEVFGLVNNSVAINAHTRAYPLVIAKNPVWDLSSARADKVRKLMKSDKLAPERIQRVSGYADRKPAVQNPMAVRNNRLELILLRSDQDSRQ